MTDMPIVLSKPDFHSDSCYTILGCGKSGSPDELRTAYRDLSRKYHPDRRRSNKDTNHTFQRVFVAYSLICKVPADRRSNDDDEDDVKFDREAMREVRLEDAKRAYTSEFGDFREKYYSKGAIVALPYPYQLKERLEHGKCLTEAFTLRLGCLQFSFFRSFLIKKDLGIFFLLSEMICVWGSLILAVWNFLLEDFPEVIDEIPYVRDADVEEGIPHISIIGGVAVLIGSFVQTFWYGFTRHPIITDSEYGNWLWDGKTSTSGELGEIYQICAQYYHSDSYHRSQILTLLFCLPILLVEHIPAILLSMPVYLALLCRYCGTKNQIPKTHLAYQFAKSIGGLFVVVGSYLAWVLGGNYAKLAVAGVLYANQHLYTAILFRRSFFGFLQSIIFQGIFAVTIVRKSSKRPKPAKEQRNTDATDIEQGKPAAPMQAPPSPPAVRRNQVSPQKTIDESIIDIVPVVSESPQKTPASVQEQADPDDFGANFDGFYTRPKSFQVSPSSAQGSIPATADPSEEESNIFTDHRGKNYSKPLPGWYQKGEVITDTQHQAAQQAIVKRNSNAVNIFQCGTTDTVLDDSEKYVDPAAASINGDKETARTGFTSTKASTTFTSATSKMESKHSEEVEPDLINLARSAKRRIEAEFYARIYGSGGPDMSSPVSPDRRAASTRRAPPSSHDEEQEQKQHRFEVPLTIEMKTPSRKKLQPKPESPASSSFPSMADATSDNFSDDDDEGNNSVPSDESSTRMENLGFIPMYGAKNGNRPNQQGSNKHINGRPTQQKRSISNRPQSPNSEMDTLLGPFVPLVKSATTRSNNYSVGASQATRMQSNKERSIKSREEDIDEEPVMRHHPDNDMTGFRNVGKVDYDKPKRSRTTGDIPDLIVGYDKASADESEITLDRRQFRKKKHEEAPSFWEYWTSPTSSTLTRSMQ